LENQDQIDNKKANETFIQSFETVDLPTIGIIENQPLLMEAIRTKLSGAFKIVLESSNAAKMIEMFNNKFAIEKTPEVIIVTEIDDFECVKWIKSNKPQIKIIILTSKNDGKSIKDFYKLNVDCFLSKNKETSKTLIKAILEVLNEGYYYPSYIRKIEMEYEEELAKLNININEPFSNREIKVMKMIYEEFTNNEIATNLDLSLRTVENVINSLLLKLKVSSRVGIAKYVIKSGILD